ncbi:hypothetical protein ETB97_003428 [Aspergillus alliaceus]|uniref:Rhodopsin domain-containing protein n=1 Tax=Petromyces alliaceus TaxID=209559 RepID=A0A8H6A1A5_PETAA|nr:hypothetical protein ETB97_003428 [Aspergillus burnettii]
MTPSPEISILAVTAVCLRLLAHHIAHKQWSPNDYFIIAACIQIFAVGLQAISITGVVQAGIGYNHVESIAAVYGLEPITKLLRLIIPLQYLWVLLSLERTKVSTLFLYLHIFPVTWVVRIAWATIGVIVAWAIATILVRCLICQPYSYNWDQTIQGGSCGNQVTSFTVTEVINLVTDVVVLVISMPLLYRLQMATYKKVTLIAVSGLGRATCVMSALRISMLSTIEFNEITYTLSRANIFSGVESCLAVILASVPMMRPLLGCSAYTPDASREKPARSSSPSTTPKLTGNKRLQPLEDDQLWLRPMGPKHLANTSSTENMSRVSQESLETREGKLTD